MRKYLITSAAMLFLGLLSYAQTPQAHQNTLSWTASPTSGVQGYNIYKIVGVCPVNPTLGAFGPKLASTTATVLTYTDTVVTSGQTNCYVITAFTAGGESSFAATLQGTTPTITAVVVVEPPGPPSLAVQ